jgi:chaperonin GroES
MRVLGDKVVVKPKGQDETLPSGIVIPAIAQEKVSEGKIIELGPDAKETGLESGETIVYSKYGGVEIEVDGDELLVLRVSDVLLVR